MKVIASLVVMSMASIAVSTSIHDLKKHILKKSHNEDQESVIGGIFDYGVQEDNVNQLAIKIATKGQPVQLSKEEQRSKWYPLKDSPLKDKGYDSWSPSANGFVFRPSEEKMNELSLFQCESHFGVHLKEESASLFHYSCGAFDASSLADKKKSLKGKSSGDGSDDGDSSVDSDDDGDDDGDDEDDTGDDAAESMLEVSKVMRQMTPQLRAFVQGAMPTFWVATPDGHVPYGWRGSWGDFDYPYYAVTDTGCYGCSLTDYVQPEYVDQYANPLTGQTGFCKNSRYFPYMGFTKNDILPYSVYYTSGAGSNWAGTVIPGSTLALQPNPYEANSITSTTASKAEATKTL